jgi:hypothetical protein
MVRRTGKVNVAVIVVVACLLTFGALSMFGGERPIQVVAKFMDALAKGDVERLTALSNAPGFTPEELKSEWERSTGEAGRYFKFIYHVQSESLPTETTAVVVVNFTPEAGSEVAYERRIEVPLSKIDGKWKVDVLALNRDIYPGMPRS